MTSKALRYTSAAQRDVFELWLYIAEKNPQAADKVLDRIEQACSRLREHPELGRARTEIGEGARALIVDRWLILYRLVPDGVQVVRIVDGARDIIRVEWKSEEPDD